MPVLGKDFEDYIEERVLSSKCEDARWQIRWRSVQALMLGMISLISAVLIISIPVPVNGMSSRPPLIPEELEDEDYFQKSYLDKSKILIKDKNNNVKGYLRRSYMDHQKMLIFDKDGKVKGYLKQDPMDSRKLKFFKE